MENRIVLAIGNDILGDDGAAFEAARILEKHYGEQITFEYVYGGGLEIFDFLEGMDRALVLDTISTGEVKPGTVTEFNQNDFKHFSTHSPHYIGLPEVIKLAAAFNVDFPNEIRILAIEIEPDSTVVEGLTPVIQDSLQNYILTASSILDQWLEEINDN